MVYATLRHDSKISASLFFALHGYKFNQPFWEGNFQDMRTSVAALALPRSPLA